VSARIAAGMLVAALVALAGPAAAAQGRAKPPAGPPAVRAPAAIVVDATTGAVLYAKHPDSRRSIASTTKLMTAFLALRSTRQDQLLTAVPYAAQAEESTLGLVAGERMTVHDLMRALLLESANDAAATLAQDIAGSRAAFVRRMNAEARALGLRGTSYANPIGLDDPDNYSTARDLATLARTLLRNPTFASIVDLPRARLASGAHPRVILNRNQLVRSEPFVDGVKTGHTGQAGYVLVGAARRGGAQVVSVVLGEPSEAARDADSLALLRYGVDAFESVPALERTRTIGSLLVNYFDGAHVRLRAARDLRLTLRRGTPVHTDLRLPNPPQVTGPLPAGARVGVAIVTVGRKRVARVQIVTSERVPGASFWRRATIDVAATGPTVALGIAGVVLLAALRLRGPLLRRMRGEIGHR
jgi:D-alanyl-D-alanine carboxypeptidase (penicillin-binding protein 5/6)